MADLLADEHISPRVVYWLAKRGGHNIQTVREHCIDKQGDGLSDAVVLQIACERRRAVLTQNVADFRRLHSEAPGHYGIITCPQCMDDKFLAKAIDRELREHQHLAGKLIHIRLKNSQSHGWLRRGHKLRRRK